MNNVRFWGISKTNVYAITCKIHPPQSFWGISSNPPYILGNNFELYIQFPEWAFQSYRDFFCGFKNRRLLLGILWAYLKAHPSPKSGSSFVHRLNHSRAFVIFRSDQNIRAAANRTWGSCSHFFKASIDFVFRAKNIFSTKVRVSTCLMFRVCLC